MVWVINGANVEYLLKSTVSGDSNDSLDNRQKTSHCEAHGFQYFNELRILLDYISNIDLLKKGSLWEGEITIGGGHYKRRGHHPQINFVYTIGVSPGTYVSPWKTMTVGLDTIIGKKYVH